MSTSEQARKISADDIRDYSTKTFVVPARQSGQKRFSIRVGDVVRELRLYRSIPAVCSALKTEEFRRANHVKLVYATGPTSGLSTKVVFTYEFVDQEHPTDARGEAYLRAERSNFYPPEERK